MKFALLHERKITGEKRVLFSPEQLAKIITNYPQYQFVVESSSTRCFSDLEYQNFGVKVQTDISDCDVLLGIKEVPLEHIIEGKIYFFFSHTTKMQPHNKWYLEGLKSKKITFFDYENLTNSFGKRLVAFGNIAGQIGCYHAFRTYGLKKQIFKLQKPSVFKYSLNLIQQIKNTYIPPIKIIVTGNGNVGQGISQFLEALQIPKVTPTNFLKDTSSKTIYCQLKKEDYLISSVSKKNKDYKYTSEFLKYVKKADIYIAGHYYEKGMPLFFTKEELQQPHLNLSTIADISCDIAFPLPTCLRTTTPQNPIYGYDTYTGKEADYQSNDSIAIMAIDNLPVELPKAASVDFGEQFTNSIMPLITENFGHPILQRALVLHQGIFTKKFQYLQHFIDPKNLECIE